MTKKHTRYALAIALGVVFAMGSVAYGSFRSSATPETVGGFEVGNGHNGLDTGGFEIGNGKEIIEIFNPEGAHSIKFYKDFDFELTGEKTWATGLLADNSAKTTLELNVKRDASIPTLSEFILNGLKQNDGAVVIVGNLRGFRKDNFDELTQTYNVDLSLHLAQGAVLNLTVQSTLEGLKEVQAIADSVKVYIN